MRNKYVSVKVYRGVLIFAASASFLCGMTLFLSGHSWGGVVALCSSVATSILLFMSAVGSNNRRLDDEEAEVERERSKRKRSEKPKPPLNYKDLN